MDELKLFVMERVYWWPCPRLFTYISTPFRIHHKITGWTCHRMQHWINWHGIAWSIGSEHRGVEAWFYLPQVRLSCTRLKNHASTPLCTVYQVLQYRASIVIPVLYSMTCQILSYNLWLPGEFNTGCLFKEWYTLFWFYFLNMKCSRLTFSKRHSLGIVTI